jgi:hypothetical protein
MQQRILSTTAAAAATTSHASLHNAAVDVQIKMCAAAPGPVLAHCTRNQLILPPLLPVLVGIQCPVQRTLHVLVLTAAVKTGRTCSRKQVSVMTNTAEDEKIIATSDILE